ncbi:MAG: hypothetical protein ACQESR_20435 [Planctomycetota bacterium]
METFDLFVLRTGPALAAVGLREKEAHEKGMDYTVEEGDRSTDNSMKKVSAKHARYRVLLAKGTGRIVGAPLLGPDVAETVNLFALAIKHALTASNLKETRFAFPTFIYDVRGLI